MVRRARAARAAKAVCERDGHVPVEPSGGRITRWTLHCPRCEQPRWPRPVEPPRSAGDRAQGGSGRMVAGRFVASWGDDYF